MQLGRCFGHQLDTVRNGYAALAVLVQTLYTIYSYLCLMIRALIYYYIESCWMFLTVISNIKIIKKRVERYRKFVFNFSFHPRLCPWLGWVELV